MIICVQLAGGVMDADEIEFTPEMIKGGLMPLKLLGEWVISRRGIGYWLLKYLNP